VDVCLSAFYHFDMTQMGLGPLLFVLVTIALTLPAPLYLRLGVMRCPSCRAPFSLGSASCTGCGISLSRSDVSK
jgi:hypothetical protein